MLSTRENYLLVADSERDANMLYAVGHFVADEFVYVSFRGKRFILINDLEANRARKHARGCRVLRMGTYFRKLKRQGKRSMGLAQVIGLFLRERRLKKVVVPASFPLGLARELRDLRVKVKVKDGAFFEDRAIKSMEEVKKISAALMMAEVGLAEGIQALKHSRIGKDARLIYHNTPLTAEKLRSIIDTAILQAGGRVTQTIVACGRQACDPHEPGYGPLKASQPIILDVFPRSQRTGYFGDITRTVVRGRASEAVRKMYHAIVRAQDIAFGGLRDGTAAYEVQESVEDFFEAEGYKTSKRNGKLEGFFHGAGHGVGLEVHEAPRINATSKDTLRAGHVVTVEPGLYYEGIGAVRLEDVALITPQSPRNLTKFEKVLEV